MISQGDGWTNPFLEFKRLFDYEGRLDYESMRSMVLLMGIVLHFIYRIMHKFMSEL